MAVMSFERGRHSYIHRGGEGGVMPQPPPRHFPLHFAYLAAEGKMAAARTLLSLCEPYTTVYKSQTMPMQEIHSRHFSMI